MQDLIINLTVTTADGNIVLYELKDCPIINYEYTPSIQAVFERPPDDEQGFGPLRGLPEGIYALLGLTLNMNVMKLEEQQLVPAIDN